VRKAVENHGHMRITSHNLWIRMWIKKRQGKDTVQVLRGAGPASRKASTVTNGGTLSYSARHKRIGQDRQSGKHSHGDRRHAWISPRKNRAEAGPPEGPGTPDREDPDQTGQASLR
jgi:hypothetical protein